MSECTHELTHCWCELDDACWASEQRVKKLETAINQALGLIETASARHRINQARDILCAVMGEKL